MELVNRKGIIFHLDNTRTNKFEDPKTINGIWLYMRAIFSRSCMFFFSPLDCCRIIQFFESSVAIRIRLSQYFVIKEKQFWEGGIFNLLQI